MFITFQKTEKTDIFFASTNKNEKRDLRIKIARKITNCVLT